MRSDERYYQTPEFQNLLKRYETALTAQTSCYLDADDFVDISAYYLDRDKVDQALLATDKGLAIHPADTEILIMRASALLMLHRLDQAEQIISSLTPNDNIDVLYVKAQLLCARDIQLDTADTLFHQWLTSEEQAFQENTQADDDTDEDSDTDFTFSEEDLREDYLHIALSFDEFYQSEEKTRPHIHLWISRYLERFSQLGAYDTDYNLADLAYDWELYPYVITIYQRLLDYNPYLKSGWAHLSEAQMLNGDYDEAIDSADFALAIDANDHIARLSKGICYYNKSNYKEAIPILQWNHDTGDHSYDTQLAFCYYSIGDNPTAQHYLDKAWQWAFHSTTLDDTEKAQLFFQIAEVYTIIEAFDRAFHSINEALALKPDDLSILMLKGEIALALGLENYAEDCFSQVVQHSDDILTTIYQIGVCYCNRSYYHKAFTIFNGLINSGINDTTFPQMPNTYAYLAITCINLGQYSQALAYLKEATTRSNTIVKNLFSEILPKDLPDADVYDYIKKNFNKIRD